MKIHFAQKSMTENISVFETQTCEAALQYVEDLVIDKDFDNSVFVCFPVWLNTEMREQTPSILISHQFDDIYGFCELYFDLSSLPQYVDFHIYEFDSYKDALNYCMLLREGV